MNETTRAAYLTDLDFFQSRLESKRDQSLYFPIAMISARLGNYDEVISVCNEGLDDMPGYTQLRVLLCEALMNVGRKDEAREQLQDIVVSDEDNYKALKLLGIIYKSENDTPNSIKYFRAAYLRAPEDTEIYGWLDEAGGLPVVPERASSVPDDNEEFASFDSDLDFNFNIEKCILEAKTAMSELMREISSDGVPFTDEELLDDNTASPEINIMPDSNLEGEELSDDDILNALNKPEEIPGAASQASGSATTPESDILNDLLYEAENYEKLLQEEHTEPAPNADDAINAFKTAAADFVTQVEIPADALPEELTSPVEPLADEGEISEENIELKEDSEVDLPPDSFDNLREAVLPPVEEIGIPEDLPQIDSSVIDEAEELITENEEELLEALNSFNNLIVEPPIPKLEEDSRLTPIIPENLINEVFSESGLAGIDPYADDEQVNPDTAKDISETFIKLSDEGATENDGDDKQ